MSMSAEDFLASQGGVAGFKWIEKNVEQGGRIEAFNVRQATKFGSGAPDYDDSGKPVMEMVIQVITDDGERRAFYCKAQQAQALRDTMIEVYGQLRSPEIGGRLMCMWYASKPSKTPGFEDQKLYRFTYTPPAPAADPVVDRMKLA